MKRRTQDSIDRRRFLAQGAGFLGLSGMALGLPSGVSAWMAPRARDARESGGRTLVLLQLSGGNDGLSTVVPYADDAYHRARESTRILGEEVLRLDEYLGLHPELLRLQTLYQAGKLAIVQGVGYPEPTRSHFRALDVWHTGQASGRRSGEGWVGRLFEVLHEGDYDPHRGVHVGDKVPYSMYSTRHPSIAFALPRAYRWAQNETDVERLLELRGDANDPVSSRAHLRDVARDALSSSRAIRSAAVRASDTAYPNERFAERLRSVASLIHAGLGTRVVSVELNGFDTHHGQRRTHDGLMRKLDGCLAAFVEDLESSQSGRDAVVLVFSEFGRRVQENGSRGTDHGAAAPLFVAGHDVKGGLHGEHPSLTDLDDGDLIHGTDFRSVYATLIEGCFVVSGTRVLGAEYPTLELL